MKQSLDLQLAAARKAGLQSLTHLRAIIWLHRPGGTTPAALAKHLDCSSAAITGMMDALENSGLIERSHSRADRRQINLYLTIKGNVVLDRILTAGAAAAV